MKLTVFFSLIFILVAGCSENPVAPVSDLGQQVEKQNSEDKEEAKEEKIAAKVDKKENKEEVKA
ncbi:hypothetical protein ACFL6H_06410, partial [Candidatus Latescibacterota bacterium]